MRRGLLTLLIGLGLSGGLAAQGPPAAPVNVDAQGVALHGYDAVAYFTQGKAVAGSPQFEHAWNGAKWRFATAAHRDSFVKVPEQYAPQFGGYCTNGIVYGTSATTWQLDDAEYARMLVRSQRESRSLARRALAVELRRRGIGDEEAAAALADVDPDAEEEAARELLRRRWRSGPGLDPQVQSRRAVAMLARKGYSPGLSAKLVREMVDDRGSEPWDPTGSAD